MKVAEVTYEGPMRRHRHRCATGQVYTFQTGRSQALSSVEDAEEFEDNTTYDVDWTVHGELLRHTGESISDVKDSIKSFGYRKKQSLAKSFGIKANQSEEKLEEELQREVKELQEVAENQ